jgi:predicted nucleotidyltransferase
MVYAPSISTSDPVLASYRATLAEVYGDRLDSVVLFGSRARGDARPDSDYDIAVFLTDITDRWAELDRLANLGVRFQDDTGALIDAKPYPSTAYRDDSPLMWEIRRDGLSL